MRMMRNATRLAAVMTLLALTGCGSLFSPNGPAPERLLLSPALPEASPALMPAQIQVARPVAGNDLDSDRIAVLTGGRVVSFLADARWTSYLPDMVQRSVVDALNTRFNGAGDEESGLKAPLRLGIDIKRFHYLEEEGSALVSLSAQLTDRKSGAILGIASLERQEGVASRSRRDVAQALEEALAGVMDELTDWAVLLSSMYLDVELEEEGE